MSKIRWWLTCILGVIALVLTGWNLHDSHEVITPVAINDNEPTYQSHHTVTLVYDPEGKLDYKLVADTVQYYTNNALTWFTYPVMTLFDGNAAASWSIRSDRARLTQDKLLDLYGNVEINSLTATSPLQKLDTNNAQVNLVTQDVFSDEKVRLSGIGTTSSGMKMRGNFRSRKAELIEEVNTYYEIQNANKIQDFLLLTSVCFIVNLPAYALQSDTRQPVHINAVKQSLDMNANTVTFTDNVFIKQGTIEIKADKVIVIRSFEDEKHVVIESFGYPVTFFQKQDNGKPVKGHAQTLRYEIKNEFIVLTGDAYLEQADSNIKGDRITYQVQQQKMEAFSDKGKQVTTTILPAQFQDENKEHKNNRKKSQ